MNGYIVSFHTSHYVFHQSDIRIKYKNQENKNLEIIF